MANETTIAKLKVDLEGDASSYEKMLKDAAAITEKSTDKIKDELKGLDEASKQIESAGSRVGKLFDNLKKITSSKVGELVGKLSGSVDEAEGALQKGIKTAKEWSGSLMDVGFDIRNSITDFLGLKDTVTSLLLLPVDKFSAAWVMASTAVAFSIGKITTAATAARNALVGMNLVAAGKVGLVAGGIALAGYGIYKGIDVILERQKENEKIVKAETNLHDLRMSQAKKESEQLNTVADALFRYGDRYDFIEEAIGQASGEVEMFREQITKLDKEINKETSFNWGRGKVLAAFGYYTPELQAKIDKRIQLMRLLKDAQTRLETGRFYTEEDDEGEIIGQKRFKDLGLYMPEEAPYGIAHQIEKAAERLAKAKDKVKSLTGPTGYGMVDDLLALAGNRSAARAKAREEEKRAQELVDQWKAYEEQLRKKQEVDPKIIKSVEDLNTKLHMQAVLWGKSGDEATLHIAKLSGVSPVLINLARQYLNWAEARKALDKFNDTAKSFKENLQDSIDTVGMSGDEIKIWRMEMDAAKKSIPGAADKIKELKELLGERNRVFGLEKERNRIKGLADSLKDQFMDPAFRLMGEVEDIQEAFDTGRIGIDTYNKAMEELEKRYHDVEDAALDARDAINSVSASLVGSAETTARWLAYQESISFRPQVAAATGGPHLPRIQEETDAEFSRRYRETGPSVPRPGSPDNPLVNWRGPFDPMPMPPGFVPPPGPNPYAGTPPTSPVPYGPPDKGVFDLIAISNVMKTLLASIDKNIGKVAAKGERTIEIGEAAFEER